ncbi:MAG: hypothetical protein V3S48_02295, partial [Candidatus Neomarinimicrobiota bacterium]
MLDQQERYYNILKLNKWFALSSILFVAIWFIVFADDYQRSWKGYQHEFRELEIEKIRTDIKNNLNELNNNPEYIALISDMEKEQAELESRKAEVERKEKEIIQLENEVIAIDKDYQFSKAESNVAVFNFEEAQYGHGDLDRAQYNMNKWVDQTKILGLKADLKTGKLE